MSDHFLEHAIELAMEHSNDGHNGPFGAVVVRDGQIIGEGWNRVVEKNDPTAHAEIVAIRQACQHIGSFNLQDCTLYSSCEPCPMCLSAIYWSRISKLVFSSTTDDAARAGFDDRIIVNELLKPWETRRIEVEHIAHEKGWKVFEKWLGNPHKKMY